MVFGALLAICVGIFFGIFTGMTPGIHVNLVCVFILSSLQYFVEYFSALDVVVCIISLALTHTFIDVIPSVYLGVPEADMALLPGQRMLLSGRGHSAIVYTTLGSLGSLLLCCVLFYPLLWFVPLVYEVVEGWIGVIVLMSVLYFLLREDKVWFAVSLFLCSGLLGFIVLGGGVRQPLLPLLSGLFGVSGLVLSLQGGGVVPYQEFSVEKVSFSAFGSGCVSAVVCGWITSVFPGLGSAQAAVLASVFVPLDGVVYMVTIGGINTANFFLSLVTLITLEKARNGAVIAVMSITDVSVEHALLLIGVGLVVAGVGSVLAVVLSRGVANVIGLVDYVLVSYSIIAFLFLVVFWLSGVMGLVVLVCSCGLGMLAPLLGVSRIHLMGCLVLPTLTYLL